MRRSAEAQLAHLVTLANPEPEHLRNAEAQLADALAAQGHYADAAELHPSVDHATRYRAIAEAIDRDDDAPGCDCQVETVTSPPSRQQIRLQNDIISEYVFSPKHRRMMPLVQCVKCGDMNVKPAPEHLARRLHNVRIEHMRAKGGPSHVTP